MPVHRCPNCVRSFRDLTAREHTESGCFLGMLVGVLQDREMLQVSSRQVAAFQDVDGLWDHYADPAADELESALRAQLSTASAGSEVSMRG
jgi:hypothetical protein